MKFGITVNIGNFNSMRAESSDHELLKDCYEELLFIIMNWDVDFESIKWWKDKLSEKINNLAKSFQPKLTKQETESLRKLEQEFEDDEDDSLKVSKKTIEVFMDLTEVSIEAFTDKAILVTKKGYQKWVPRSVIDPQVDLSQLQKGQYYGIIPLHARGEKWFHDKKTWEVYRVL